MRDEPSSNFGAKCVVILGLLLIHAPGIATIAWAAEKPSAVAPLLKLLRSGRLPAERMATVVEMVCKRGNQHDLQIMLDNVMSSDQTSPELKRQLVQWLTDAAVTRKVQPEGDRSGVRVLIDGPQAGQQPALQRAAIRLVSVWRDDSSTPALLALAHDPQADPETQRAVIEGLVAMNRLECHQALHALAQKGPSAENRMQAIAGLTSVDIDAAANYAASFLESVDPAIDLTGVVAAFLQRSEGPRRLGEALSRASVSVDTAKRMLRTMYVLGRSDPELANALSKAAGLEADVSPPTPEEIAQVVADVNAHGDAARGEEVFRRKDLNCMKCHSLNRAGGQVGPELTGVGGASPLEYIVTSILDPSRAMKEQYATRRFLLSTGQMLVGVVIDRDEIQVNMRDAQGQTIAIPVADIDEETEGQSLMPQGMTRFLTRDELIDLARFVSELGRPGPYAVSNAKTLQRWRRMLDPSPELTDDVPHLDHPRQFVLSSEPSSWESIYAKVSGELPLRELFTGRDPAVLILQSEFRTAGEGRILVLAASTNTVQIWVDTELLAPNNRQEIAVPAGLHTVTVRVEQEEHSNPNLRIELQTPVDSSAAIDIPGGP